ncbi:hypothetical protein [Erythrobacter insulae]|uniref:hypothetical protein n=1 Tax=Erythrobacter insulae TaxID=2584124 RepID=UPI00163D4240|nr:hypothetical protein [Erythrobacter insulae]
MASLLAAKPLKKLAKWVTRWLQTHSQLLTMRLPLLATLPMQPLKPLKALPMRLLKLLAKALLLLKALLKTLLPLLKMQ